MATSRAARPPSDSWTCTTWGRNRRNARQTAGTANRGNSTLGPTTEVGPRPRISTSQPASRRPAANCSTCSPTPETSRGGRVLATRRTRGAGIGGTLSRSARSAAPPPIGPIRRIRPIGPIFEGRPHPPRRLLPQSFESRLFEPPQEPPRIIPSPLEPIPILRQPGETELRQPRLPGTEHVPGPADLQVRLGDHEAVVGLLEDLQAALRLGGPLAVEGEAEGRPRAASDPAAELMELGETEALGALQD